MTAQEAYEKIHAHFSQKGARLAQATPDESDTNSCRYRLRVFAGDPVRCAFGVLIPNDLYDPSFESNGCDAFFTDTNPTFRDVGDLLSEGLTNDEVDTLRSFAEEAQNDHDTSLDVSDFLDRLDSTARHSGLTTIERPLTA